MTVLPCWYASRVSGLCEIQAPTLSRSARLPTSTQQSHVTIEKAVDCTKNIHERLRHAVGLVLDVSGSNRESSFTWHKLAKVSNVLCQVLRRSWTGFSNALLRRVVLHILKQSFDAGEVGGHAGSTSSLQREKSVRALASAGTQAWTTLAPHRIAQTSYRQFDPAEPNSAKTVTHICNFCWFLRQMTLCPLA